MSYFRGAGVSEKIANWGADGRNKRRRERNDLTFLSGRKKSEVTNITRLATSRYSSFRSICKGNVAIYTAGDMGASLDEAEAFTSITNISIKAYLELGCIIIIAVCKIQHIWIFA